MLYKQLKNGDIRVLRHGLHLHVMCCDCGLVHIYQHKRVPGTHVLHQRVFRDERATAAARRAKRFKGMKLPK